MFEATSKSCMNSSQYRVIRINLHLTAIFILRKGRSFCTLLIFSSFSWSKLSFEQFHHFPLIPSLRSCEVGLAWPIPPKVWFMEVKSQTQRLTNSNFCLSRLNFEADQLSPKKNFSDLERLETTKFFFAYRCCGRKYPTNRVQRKF